MRFIRSALAAFALAVSPAAASPLEIADALAGAQKVGQARYHLFSVSLFTAELWAEHGTFSWERPFALSLTYERSARASVLVNRTISEMSRRGAGAAQNLTPLRTQLAACFPNVGPGDRITGVSTSANTALFFINGAQRCAIEWPNFRRHFFGIWLDARGGQAAMSARLRGDA